MYEFFIVIMMGFVLGALAGTIASWIIRTWSMEKKRKKEIDEIKKSHELEIKKLEEQINQLKNHLYNDMQVKAKGTNEMMKKLERLMEEKKQLDTKNQAIFLTLNAIRGMAPQYQQENNLTGLISFIEYQSSIQWFGQF